MAVSNTWIFLVRRLHSLAMPATECTVLQYIPKKLNCLGGYQSCPFSKRNTRLFNIDWADPFAAMSELAWLTQTPKSSILKMAGGLRNFTTLAYFMMALAGLS
jgi:hypothetical protein